MSKAALNFEKPNLLLALEGFTPQQQAIMKNWLEEEVELTESLDIRWTISNRSEADGLLIAHETSSEYFKQILQEAIPHALMWILPPKQEDQSPQAPKQHFLMALLELSQQVQQACMRYALASMMVERYSKRIRMTGLWHLQRAGVLLAVVDFQRLAVAVRSETHFKDLEHANWVPRSEQAVAPPGFVHCSIEHLMWYYTKRTQRFVLPAKYMQSPISLRRLPRLPLALLGEHALVAITLLRKQSLNLTQLAVQMGLSIEQASRLMATLYFCSAITTKPQTLWRRLAEKLHPQPSNPFADTSLINAADSPLSDGANLYSLKDSPKLLS
jgi:hypothetical protein